jgi:exonuclease SbcC
LLEVNIADTESGLFRPLTRTSTRETQALLDGLLRMDYETFLNSAYLRQGMADKFSRQAPGDRKRILAEILGLSRYQEIADRARADNRVEETKVAQLEGQIENIERYLAGREEAQRQHDFYDDALRTLRPQIEALQTKVNELTERKIGLNQSRKRAEQIAGEIAAEVASYSRKSKN